MSIMNEVREAISTSHDSIELTPYSKGMMDGSLGKRDYGRGLAQLLQIHRAIENNISKCDTIRHFFTDEMIRVPTIERDLRALGTAESELMPLAETKLIVCAIESWFQAMPCAVLGCIYILEGSRMGSLVIAKPLAKTLGIPAGTSAGIEYHVEGAATTPQRVRRLKSQIDEAAISSAEKEDLKYGAVQFMEMLNLLYAHLPVHSTESIAAAPKCPFSHQSIPSGVHHRIKTA